MTKKELVEIGMDFFLEHFPTAKKRSAMDFVTSFVSELKEQGVIDFEEEYEDGEDTNVEW